MFKYNKFYLLFNCRNELFCLLVEGEGQSMVTGFVYGDSMSEFYRKCSAGSLEGCGYLFERVFANSRRKVFGSIITWVRRSTRII